MPLKDLRDDIVSEVATILAADFSIDVVKTDVVPHSGDPAITFPNLDTRTQGAKLIDTCVLYIDIRRSTELNMTHKPKTVAKLYSAFVRAMTRCARYHKGHVRGIIGDRVMVLFDRKNAFTNAVECAISMNTISQHVINTYFTRGEVECGIGIDAGNMLATKTGVRRRGVDLASYRNLVWLGRPANVASKLTDLANKPADTVSIPVVSEAYRPDLFSSNTGWTWKDTLPTDFVRSLSMVAGTDRLQHSNPAFTWMLVNEKNFDLRPKTAPILMTEVVWRGYQNANPNDPSVQNQWFREIALNVSGYQGKVFSGDVVHTALQD